ncbi:CRISPR-associated protein [Thermus filiformis]|uniref:CRISPR-associated protein n=1 Tax=Thermus filiformis TaxID=276 RepID=A0A0A2WSS7_THEFI|nr:CRISPR-associated protein [Thermus filiformis]KGQ21370.2 CRISPR-associated protein [Thermus filiformis]
MQTVNNPGDLEPIWQAYREAVRAGGNPHTLYREMVWPHLLALWRTAPQVYPERRSFRVSIHTLGTSPEATTLAVLGTGAEEVYVLHTEETRRHLDQLEADANRRVYPKEVHKSDVAQIYQQVYEILKRLPKDTPVALDITSGTKAMSAGLAAVGFFFRRHYSNLQVVYVDNEEYDQELRRPKAGTERLMILPNPHEAVGEVDVLLAQELYEKGDFTGASGYFSGLVKQTGRQEYVLYATLSEMYGAWWALKFEEALRKGKSLLERLGNDPYLLHPLNRQRPRLQAQVELLEEANRFLDSKDLGQRRGVLAVAATLLHLSEEEEHPSLKALYAYRALELLLQERLHRHGRRAEDPRLSPEEKEALGQELARILGGEARVGDRLGLLDVMAFLRVLGDPVLKGMSLQEVQGLKGVLQARNQSLLVHGLEVPTEKEVGKVAKGAKGLLRALQDELRLQPSLEPAPLEFWGRREE